MVKSVENAPQVHKEATGVKNALDKVRWRYDYAIATLIVTYLAPALGYADDAKTILEKIRDLLKGGLGFLGGAMVVFGGIIIGINVHGTAQGNGGQISQGVAVLIGGVIISAAAIFFGNLSIDWATPSVG